MSRIKPPSLRGPRGLGRPSRTDETSAPQERKKPALEKPGSGFDRKRPARTADAEGRVRLRLARPTTTAERQALRDRLGPRGATFREALVNFQRENGLTQTGALSPATLRRLERLGVARDEGSRFPEALTSLFPLPKPGALQPKPLLAAADAPPVESRELAEGVGRLIGRRLTPEPIIDSVILPHPVGPTPDVVALPYPVGGPRPDAVPVDSVILPHPVGGPKPDVAALPHPVVDSVILPFPISSGVLLGTVAPDGATTSQAERARDALQFFLGD